MKKVIIIIIFLITLIVVYGLFRGFAYYRQINSGMIKVEKLESDKKNLSIKGQECIDSGGKIITVESREVSECPDNKEILGWVNDLWCHCICCR